ncbi:MAG: hypothetical protein ACJ73D_09255, partial [Pyrinomonadaceae bacterium]
QYNDQGQKYGIDIPAFDTTGFFLLDTRATVNGVVNPTFNQLVVPAYGNNYDLTKQNVLRNIPFTLNNFRNQFYQKFDAGLTKNFKIREGMKLQVRVEAINLMNWVYFSDLNLVPGAGFGIAASQRNLPRDIQLGARFTF